MTTETQITATTTNGDIAAIAGTTVDGPMTAEQRAQIETMVAERTKLEVSKPAPPRGF